MSAPPQRRPNAARHAERDAKIFRFKLAGLTERQIAAEVELSPARVHEIITEQVAETVGPVATEYADHREAELQDLYRKAYALAVSAKDPADRLRAVATCQRLNESRRKLRGADAAEAITVTLEQRNELDSKIVAEVLALTLDAVTDALPDLDLVFRDRLRRYAFEVAQHALTGMDGRDPGPAPEVPVPQLAITTGRAVRPSDGPAGGGDPDLPPKRPRDAADSVLDVLAAMEAEFPEAFEGDDDGPEDDQASVA